MILEWLRFPKKILPKHPSNLIKLQDYGWEYRFMALYYNKQKVGTKSQIVRMNVV